MLKTEYENKMTGPEAQAANDASRFQQNIALIASSALPRYLKLSASSWEPGSVFARHYIEYTKILSSALSFELAARQADNISKSSLSQITEATYQIGGDGTPIQLTPRRVERKKWQLLPGVPAPQWLPQEQRIRDREASRMEAEKGR